MFDASLLDTVGSRQRLDVIIGKIENDLERGFAKHRLNCPLITDPDWFCGVVVAVAVFVVCLSFLFQ